MTATVRTLPPTTRPMPLPSDEKARRAAYARGFDNGERYGHVRGWRIGMGYGLLYGCLAGMVAMWALIAIGRAL